MKRLIALSAIALAACSSSSNDEQPKPPATPPVTTAPPPGSTSKPPPPPPPTPGCTFAGYVIDQIKSKTTAAATPDTTLGESCAPSTSQDDFKSLF